MKSEIKTLWLEALRSDEYEQTTHALSRDDGCYCCLGVLCEIAKKYGVVSKHYIEEDKIFMYNDEKQLLPDEVVYWAGLPDQNPYCRYNNETTVLTMLNDDYELNFKEIANIIEEQL